jgi:hypothetical protein
LKPIILARLDNGIEPLERPMKKCGRPNQNGEHPIWMLVRVTLAVYGFHQARRAGAKHFAAIQAAVAFVRALHPEMPVSETEVRRILADWQSSRRPLGLLVSEADPSDYVVTFLRDGSVGKVNVLWTAAIGPRPTYPR